MTRLLFIFITLLALLSAPVRGDDTTPDDYASAQKIREADDYVARRVRPPTDEKGRRIRMPGVERAARIILKTSALRKELLLARSCRTSSTEECSNHEIDLITRCLGVDQISPSDDEIWCRFNYRVDAFIRATEILEDAAQNTKGR